MIKKILASALYASLWAQAAFASTKEELCKGSTIGTTNTCDADAQNTLDNALTGKVDDIVNLLLYVTAALAVIVIIVGGLRYVTSTGDASRIKAAKDTIFYGITGLVVAILAYAIVNFVIRQLGG